MDSSKFFDKAKQRCFYLTDTQHSRLRNLSFCYYSEADCMSKMLRYMAEVYDRQCNEGVNVACSGDRSINKNDTTIRRRYVAISMKDKDYDFILKLSKKTYGNIGFNMSATVRFLIDNEKEILKNESNITKIV